MAQPNNEVLDLVKGIQVAIARGDGKNLKRLAAEVGEQVLLRADPSLVGLAVIAYSMGKFWEKPYIVSSPEWRSYGEKIDKALSQAVEAFSRNDSARFQSALGQASALVDEVSTKLGRFVRSYAEKARIKVGADMYAHGASLGKAAELAVVDKRDLSEYIGVTTLAEKYVTMPLKKRLEMAMELF